MYVGVCALPHTNEIIYTPTASGIGTYSQAGAQFGFGIGWTMLLTYPLMVAIQEISARTGRTTGHGIAGNLCRHYANWLLYGVVTLLFIANTINIGADLSAIADAIRLLIGGPAALYVVLLGTICVVAIVFMTYERYVWLLKWLTLSLFAYVAALFAIKISWGEAVFGAFVPRIVWTNAYFTTLLAIFGTTISAYLFFWEAALEAEDQRVNPLERPLVRAPHQAPQAFERIRADTLIGMGFSNLIALAIIFTTAATLHQAGITSIESSTQAAEALRPIASDFAFLLFALGISGQVFSRFRCWRAQPRMLSGKRSSGQLAWHASQARRPRSMVPWPCRPFSAWLLPEGYQLLGQPGDDALRSTVEPGWYALRERRDLGDAHEWTRATTLWRARR